MRSSAGITNNQASLPSESPFRVPFHAFTRFFLERWKEGKAGTGATPPFRNVVKLCRPVDEVGFHMTFFLV